MDRADLCSNFDSALKPSNITSPPYGIIVEEKVRCIVESIGKVIEERNWGYDMSACLRQY
jgi:hypothetical protein